VLIKLPSGYIQPSPWLGIGNKQLELMAKYVAELGLSPVSRTRVEAKPPYQRKPWEFGREWVDPRSKFAGLIGPRHNSPRTSSSGETTEVNRSDGWCRTAHGRHEPREVAANTSVAHP
jgi:hypothetical protein